MQIANKPHERKLSPEKLGLLLHTHTHAHTHTHTYTHTHTHSLTHTHSNSRTHTHTRTYTHTDNHTHTRRRGIRNIYLRLKQLVVMKFLVNTILTFLSRIKDCII